jgi:hypothetical protein
VQLSTGYAFGEFDSCSVWMIKSAGVKVPAPLIRRGICFGGWKALATRPKRFSRLLVALTCPLSVRTEGSDP